MIFNLQRALGRKFFNSKVCSSGSVQCEGNVLRGFMYVNMSCFWIRWQIHASVCHVGRKINEIFFFRSSLSSDLRPKRLHRNHIDQGLVCWLAATLPHKSHLTCISEDMRKSCEAVKQRLLASSSTTNLFSFLWLQIIPQTQKQLFLLRCFS